MESKLKSAESAIVFIQKEHERVLHGLHLEIQRLQQKCSDLQFVLSAQTASAETEAELRSLLSHLQEDSDMNRDLVIGLQSELEKNQQKVNELQEQLQWQELQHHNQLNLKEARIQEFKKSNSGGLKNIQDREQSAATLTSEQIAQKFAARKSPSAMTVGRRSSQPQEPSSNIRTLSQISDQVPETRAKVFRHQLQRVKSLNMSSQCSPIEPTRSSDRQPWSVNRMVVYDSYAETSEALSKGQTALPVYFKATVATLPPIAPTSATHHGRSREVNVTSMAVDAAAKEKARAAFMALSFD